MANPLRRCREERDIRSRPQRRMLAGSAMAGMDIAGAASAQQAGTPGTDAGPTTLNGVLCPSRLPKTAQGRYGEVADQLSPAKLRW